MTPKNERLNKLLALQGLGSRRSVDTLIAAGRITVDGQIATLGQKVMPTQQICVDGNPIASARKHATVILALNKPKGITSTRHDPHARMTVMQLLPSHYQHLYPIGRLDKDSRGLLLLTNDGDLAYRLTHPKYEHEKEYNVTVVPQTKTSSQKFRQDIERLTTTIISPEHQSRPPRVLKSTFETATNQGSVTLVLKEGKKRQIRRLFQSLGYHVVDLCRTRIGSVRLDQLRPGEYSNIDPKLVDR